MEPILTVEAAAKKLSVSPKTVREWLRSGKLRGVKVGKFWRMRESDLDAFLPGVEGKSDMANVIRRLRASRRRARDEQYRAGEAAGRWWAEQYAEADELERLEEARNRYLLDWPRFFQQHPSDRDTVGYRFVMVIRPDSRENPWAAKEFWDETLSEEEAFKADDPSYVWGFAEGALALWAAVKDRL